MKRVILALSLSVACSLIVNAQQTKTTASVSTSSQTAATANEAGKSITLASGTSLSGQLQNSIDVRRAKVGDQVVLKTTQTIKSEGRTVVDKGSRLIGHVTEVAQKGQDNSASRVGILFDRIENGSLQMPIAATITSITNGSAGARTNNDDVFGTDTMASGSARSTSSARSSSSGGGGGLLGAAGGAVNSTTSTVGNVVGSTTSAVGTTVDSTANAVGGTATGVGRSLGGIQVSQSSKSSAEGGSVLSLQGGNLKLEKGTNFNLVLIQSASAGSAKNQ
jgi:hypothetical protein